MIRLIIGIILVILPVPYWFGEYHFVEKMGTTMFYWFFGILFIIAGTDKITPGGIWKSGGDSSDSNSDDSEYKTIQHYDQWGENSGYSKIPIKKKKK